MAREMCFGKNVSFKASNIQIVQEYMNKTKKNFSQTVNIILQEWDTFSIIIMKWKQEQATIDGLKHIDDMKKAEVIKK